jgi:hypothetical protein
MASCKLGLGLRFDIEGVGSVYELQLLPLFPLVAAHRVFLNLLFGIPLAFGSVTRGAEPPHRRRHLLATRSRLLDFALEAAGALEQEPLHSEDRAYANIGYRVGG